MRIQVILVLALFQGLFASAQAKDEADIPLRVGLVKFGAASWEIASIRSHLFDRAAGLDISTVDLANPGAGELALQGAGVDVILSDWLWVSRQRQAGQKITFIPHTSALGEILVPATSPIRQLSDLEGKRLGIAGGPLDKSWLLLRAFSRAHFGHDLADRVEAVYATPPLLSQELTAGRIDAVLTYWPYAARLDVRGFRSLATMAEIEQILGFSTPIPMLGYAFSDAWIAAHPGGLERFLRATQQADSLLRGSDEEWNRLRPLLMAEDDAVFVALRERFRNGIITRWGAAERAEVAKLFTLLVQTGGSEISGGAAEIDPGTFWNGTFP